MAWVSFDLHPSAYKLTGPIEPKPTHNTKLLIGAPLLMVLCMATSGLCSELIRHGMNYIITHYAWILSTAMSSIIGFGTATRLYNSVDQPSLHWAELPTDKYRNRSGANFIKRAKRHWNRDQIQGSVKRGRNMFDFSELNVPARWARNRLSPDPKFNNVGRDRRNFERPTVWKLQSKVTKLEALVQKLSKLVWILEDRIEVLEQSHDSKRFVSSLRCLMADAIHDSDNNEEHQVASAQAGGSGSEDTSRKVLFDSGANCRVSNKRKDFIKFESTTDQNLVIDGIGRGLRICGKGTVFWIFGEGDTERVLELPAFYVPSCNTRIASLQAILDECRGETFQMDKDRLVLSGDDVEPPLVVPIDPRTKLPTATLSFDVPPPSYYVVDVAALQSYSAVNNTLPSTSQPPLTASSNINLTEPEKELLRWHQRLGHISIKRIQWMMRQGFLATSERLRCLHASASKLHQGPMCTACQYAKQRRKTAPGSIKKTVPTMENALKENNMFPGSRISVDHFEANPRGRLLNMFGKE